MPRKEKTPEAKPKVILQPRKGEQADEWGGFVQANLTPIDKALYDEWYGQHHESIQQRIDTHIGLGLKLTVVFDGEHNSYIASYTGRPNTDESLPFRCTLSARSGEFIDALALLVYKHEVICNGDWADFLINGARVSNWG